jgi:hypothetical protein
MLIINNVTLMTPDFFNLSQKTIRVEVTSS